jgi:hypothetical protein
VYDLGSGLHYLRRLNILDRDSRILHQQPDFQGAKLERASQDYWGGRIYTSALAGLLLHHPTCKRHSIAQGLLATLPIPLEPQGLYLARRPQVSLYPSL